MAWHLSLSAYPSRRVREFASMTRAACTPESQTRRERISFALPVPQNTANPRTIHSDTREVSQLLINTPKPDVLAQPLPESTSKKYSKRSLENSWLEYLVLELVKADSIHAVEDVVMNNPISPSHSLPYISKGTKKAGVKDHRRPDTVHQNFHSPCVPLTSRHASIILRKLDQLHKHRTALLVSASVIYSAGPNLSSN